MRVFVIAGEASGDKLGAALMAGLRDLVPGVEFRGIGGEVMTGQGLTSLFAMDELSIMGIVEVLPKYFHLKRRIREAAAAALDWQPDVIITIDSPDFCLRVAAIVKAARNVRIIHYVAPSVWAWRPKRAAKMARVIDHVLALLPFEPPYMHAAGMGCDFVGHPVVADPVASDDDIAAFRIEYGIADAPVLLVLPGSRRGEISRMGAVFGKVLAQTCLTHPETRVVIPVAPGRFQQVQAMAHDWPGQPVLIPPDNPLYKRASFRAADVALAASGTVALELAACDTPMVVAYDVTWLSRKIMQHMALIDSVNLVNLVAETKVVPEFIGDKCKAGLITPALVDLLENPAGQGDAMRLTMQRLGQGGENPGLRAARAVLGAIGASSNAR